MRCAFLPPYRVPQSADARRNTNFHNCSKLTVSAEESLVTAIAQPGRWVQKNKHEAIARLRVLNLAGLDHFDPV
jgi:hypothetical protein